MEVVDSFCNGQDKTVKIMTEKLDSPLKIEVPEVEETMAWGDICQTPDVNNQEEMEFLPLEELEIDFDEKESSEDPIITGNEGEKVCKSIGIEDDQPSSSVEVTPKDPGEASCDGVEDISKEDATNGCPLNQELSGDPLVNSAIDGESTIPPSIGDSKETEINHLKHSATESVLEKAANGDIRSVGDSPNDSQRIDGAVTQTKGDGNSPNVCLEFKATKDNYCSGDVIENDDDAIRKSEEVIAERLRVVAAKSPKSPECPSIPPEELSNSHGSPTIPPERSTSPSLPSAKSSDSQGSPSVPPERSTSPSLPSSKSSDSQGSPSVPPERSTSPSLPSSKSSCCQENPSILPSRDIDESKNRVDTTSDECIKAEMPGRCADADVEVTASSFVNNGGKSVKTNGSNEEANGHCKVAKADAPQTRKVSNVSCGSDNATSQNSNRVSESDEVTSQGSGEAEPQLRPRGFGVPSEVPRVDKKRNKDVSKDIKTDPGEDIEGWRMEQLKGLSSPIIDNWKTKFFVLDTSKYDLMTSYKTGRFYMPDNSLLRRSMDIMKDPIVFFFVNEKEHRQICSLGYASSPPSKFLARGRETELFGVNFLSKAKARKLCTFNYRPGDEMERKKALSLLGQYAGFIKQGFVDKVMDEVQLIAEELYSKPKLASKPQEQAPWTMIKETPPASPNRNHEASKMAKSVAKRPAARKPRDEKEASPTRQYARSNSSSSDYEVPPRLQRKEPSHKTAAERETNDKPAALDNKPLKVDVNAAANPPFSTEPEELWSPTSPTSQPNYHIRLQTDPPPPKEGTNDTKGTTHSEHEISKREVFEHANHNKELPRNQYGFNNAAPIDPDRRHSPGLYRQPSPSEHQGKLWEPCSQQPKHSQRQQQQQHRQPSSLPQQFERQYDNHLPRQRQFQSLPDEPILQQQQRRCDALQFRPSQQQLQQMLEQPQQQLNFLEQMLRQQQNVTPSNTAEASQKQLSREELSFLYNMQQQLFMQQLQQMQQQQQRPRSPQSIQPPSQMPSHSQMMSQPHNQPSRYSQPHSPSHHSQSQPRMPQQSDGFFQNPNGYSSMPYRQIRHDNTRQPAEHWDEDPPKQPGRHQRPDQHRGPSKRTGGIAGSREDFGSDDEPERDLRRECDVFGLSEEDLKG